MVSHLINYFLNNYYTVIKNDAHKPMIAKNETTKTLHMYYGPSFYTAVCRAEPSLWNQPLVLVGPSDLPPSLKNYPPVSLCFS